MVAKDMTCKNGENVIFLPVSCKFLHILTYILILKELRTFSCPALLDLKRSRSIEALDLSKSNRALQVVLN